MPSIRHPSSFIAILVILCLCAPLHAFVVPWTISNSNPAQQPAEQHQPSYKARSVFPQLTYLRDTFVETFFRLPAKATKSAFDKPSPQVQSPKLPGNLLAKYGGEVVLRFTLETPEEERALAEAANTLFLDVWEFTNNWADIRLREDDVC